MTAETSYELDLDARYTVDGYHGIAFWIQPRMVATAETEWTGEREQDPDHVTAVMIGDDHAHVVDVRDLQPIGEDDYCHECGQVGCAHDGRDRGEEN
jgi:hypothetical protein